MTTNAMKNTTVLISGGDIEIRRGDLAELLFERTAVDCEYIFGESMTSLTETANGVHVTFECGAPRTFDLVVGADGIHSNVRRLAFGPEKDYVKHLGHYYALADLDLDFGQEGLMYNEPGRMVQIGGTKSAGFFVFASPELTYGNTLGGFGTGLAVVGAYVLAGELLTDMFATRIELPDYLGAGELSQDLAD